VRPQCQAKPGARTAKRLKVGAVVAVGVAVAVFIRVPSSPAHRVSSTRVCRRSSRAGMESACRTAEHGTEGVTGADATHPGATPTLTVARWILAASHPSGRCHCRANAGAPDPRRRHTARSAWTHRRIGGRHPLRGGPEVKVTRRRPPLAREEVKPTRRVGSLGHGEVKLNDRQPSLGRREVKVTGRLPSLGREEVRLTGRLASLGRGEVKLTGWPPSLARGEVRLTR
jgi:hypothetical protein